MLHVPVSGSEVKELAKFFASQMQETPTIASNCAERLRFIVYQIGERSPILKEMAQMASATVLPERTAKSIMGYLLDLVREDNVGSTSLHIQTGSRMPHASLTHRFSRTMLQNASRLSRAQYKESVLSTLGPSLAYTYMSGDVGTIAFAANSNAFLAGSVCDESSEYNYPGNLVIGDVSSRHVYDLDYHWKKDKRVESSASRLFYTVSMVDFSADGKYFFSAGYDGNIRAYEIDGAKSGEISYVNKNTTISCPSYAWLGGPVDLLRTSKIHGLIATGTQLAKTPISLFQCSSDGTGPGDSTGHALLHLKTQLSPFSNRELHPSCLQWGPSYAQNLLLAGFMDAGEEAKNGELALWDVECSKKVHIKASQGIIFDVNWSPHSVAFAAAIRPGFLANKFAKSLIRLYDIRTAENTSISWSRGIEWDCPAKDINDIVFSPHDDRILAAGTTEGKIFVYDLRNPADALHTLSHRAPIDRKEAKDDTGVRFCAWNHSRHGLITGASDGIVKSWDIYQSAEDTHTSDVATFSSGIYSGAFSPDYTYLAIGEVKKSFTILEPFNKGRGITDLDGFEIIKGSPPDVPDLADQDEIDSSLNPATTAETTEISCKIPLCRELEELEGPMEESRRWNGRIPANLLKTMDHMVAVDKKTRLMAIQSSKKCISCGGAAHPSMDSQQQLFPLCERCGFSCIRCGERRKLKPSLERVVCSCGEWIIGALGYEFVDGSKQKAGVPVTGDVPLVSTVGIEEISDDEESEFDAAEYYHTKWNLKVWNKYDSSYLDMVSGEKILPPKEIETTTDGRRKTTRGK